MRRRIIPTLTASIHFLFRIIFALMLLTGSGIAQSGTTATDGFTPEGLKAGKPAGSFQLSDFDNVNYFNGNLNFSLPLLGIGGRGDVGYTIPLRIERKWQVRSYRNPRYVNVPEPGSWEGVNYDPGYSPGVVIERHPGEIPQVCDDSGEYPSLARLTFISADGTEHELIDTATNGANATTYWSDCRVYITPNRGKTFTSRDGSGITFISSQDVLDSSGYAGQVGASGFLLLPNGTRYSIENGHTKWIRDRNGNKMTFTYSFGQVVSITDSLNRQTTISNASLPGGQDYDQISYRGFGGATKILVVRYKLLSQLLRSGSVQTYQQLFPELNGSSSEVFDGWFPAAVELPDGRSYQFKYNAYGELARIELPTGGAIEYDYAAGIVGAAESGSYSGYLNRQIHRRIIERRLYVDKNNSVYSYKTTISRPETKNGISYHNIGYVDVESRD